MGVANNVGAPLLAANAKEKSISGRSLVNNPPMAHRMREPRRQMRSFFSSPAGRDP
jgi:hypothetical protein